MSYQIIQPPFTLDFPNMTKKDLRAYKNWFIEIIPQRIEILTDAIHATVALEDWKPDFSPQSLYVLEEWFPTQVGSRRTTEEEKAAYVPGKIITVPPEWDLTSKTYSLCIDIGMYLSQVFLKAYPRLKWAQPIGSKNHIDYGQPVLIGFGKHINFNPVRMLTVQAYKLVPARNATYGIRNLYDIWSQNISIQTSSS